MYSGGYYHIINIGMIYEKGFSSGHFWKRDEKNRIKDECALWLELVNLSDSVDKAGAEKLAMDKLRDITKKYPLPNYEKLIELIPQVGNTALIFPAEEYDAAKDYLVDIINRIACEVDYGTRKSTYALLEKAHNIPRYFYHEDLFGKGGGARFDDVIEWSR